MSSRARPPAPDPAPQRDVDRARAQKRAGAKGTPVRVLGPLSERWGGRMQGACGPQPRRSAACAHEAPHNPGCRRRAEQAPPD